MADYVIEWDKSGEKKFETGVKHVVLYPFNSTSNAYKPGVAWNGVTNITEKPTGAESTALYADDIKYLNLISAEDLEASIEAYTYPDEFAECDGSKEIIIGVTIGQQERKVFGLSYITTYGNDLKNTAYGYKLHLVYGCTASPSERAYSTINDSPEANNFSWEIKTTPVNVTGGKPTAILTIDSTKFTDTAAKAKLDALLQKLYGTPAGSGTDEVPAELPDPDTVIGILNGTING